MDSEATPPPNPSRKRARQAAAWAIVALIGTGAVSLFVFHLRHLDSASRDLTVPWWAMIVAFAVAEMVVVHVHFRSETGTFSLLELPLVFALLFADPSTAVVAMAVGATMALAIVRRQPVLKLAFNVANLALHMGLAITMMQWLLGDADPLDPSGWLILLASTSATGVVNVAMILLIVAATEGRFDARRGLNVAMFGLLVSVANTSQGIVAALVVVTEPWAVPFLLCTAAVLLAAYRAYVSEREQRERVEFLQSSTQALRASGHSNVAISAFVTEAAAMFRAESVLVVLLPPVETDDPPALYAHRNGITTAETITTEEAKRASELATAAGQGILLAAEGGDPRTTGWLAERQIDHALVGALRTEKRLVGLLVVADRLGTVSAFGEAELRLIKALSQQAAVALENDQLDQALIQLRELGQELEHQARSDGLTGLANRTSFVDRLDEQYVVAGDDATVLYIDLDDFKLVNDTYGHSAGDGLLCEVAQRIRDCVRPSDVPARLGGDEFAVLLADGTESEGIAHRIVGALTAPFIIDGNEIRIGASIGRADQATASSGSQLLRNADAALYLAKEQGKGTVAAYDRSMDEYATRQQALQSALRRAVTDDEFEVHYQPIVWLDDLSIAGAEALVRWRKPSGRLATPLEFIHEAEQSGLILSVDRLVRKEVLSELSRLLEVNDRMFVSVNLSARHFLRPGLVDEIAEDLLISRVPPQAIVLEITESVLVRDVSSATKTLSELRELGLRLALDDFGTGYSSLSYLRNLPVDILKIAQPFIDDMDATGDAAFVSAISELGSRLGFTMIAEGIESEGADRTLREMGCHLGQGFHYARPQPAEDLLRIMNESGVGRPVAVDGI